jgi:hypothetical protein
MSRERDERERREGRGRERVNRSKSENNNLKANNSLFVKWTLFSLSGLYFKRKSYSTPTRGEGDEEATEEDSGLRREPNDETADAETEPEIEPEALVGVDLGGRFDSIASDRPLVTGWLISDWQMIAIALWRGGDFANLRERRLCEFSSSSSSSGTKGTKGTEAIEGGTGDKECARDPDKDFSTWK